MKTKRILILALGIVLGACSAGEPQVEVAPTAEVAPRVKPIGLNERYIDHFVEQGFNRTDHTGYDEYLKDVGRGFIVVAITYGEDEPTPMFGFVSRINAHPEEYDLSLAHLYEAASFLDPVDGKNIVFSAMEETVTNSFTMTDEGFISTHWWADGQTWSQFIHTSTGQEVVIYYYYEEENLIKVFFTYLPEDLVLHGTDSAEAGLNPTNYSFGPLNQGLSLSNALADSAQYSIEMVFNFSDLSGYRKIIDFKNLASDKGLYTSDTALEFYPRAPGPSGAFTEDVDAHLVVTRDGSTNQFIGYVDGVQQISFIDSGGDTVFTSNIIQFFKDDFESQQDEVSAGAVDRILIYDSVLTPSEVTALFQGTGGPAASHIYELNGSLEDELGGPALARP